MVFFNNQPINEVNDGTRNRARQDKTTLLHLHDTLMTDVAPQVANLIEADQEQ